MAEPQLDLSRRAAYRRVLAILKARKCPFVVAGALAISMHIGDPVEGPLEIFVRHPDAGDALAALAAAGFKVEVDPDGTRARIGSAEHTVFMEWRLPPPLGGEVDEAWFRHATRRPFVDLRVRVAPPEELLWLRLASSGDDLGDRVVDAVLLRRGPTLDWQRLLGRLAGLEAQVLAHLFALHHRHPDTARRVVPHAVIELLLSRFASVAGVSFDHPSPSR